MGIFEYILDITRETNLNVGSTGAFLWLVLIMWYSFCRMFMVWILLVDFSVNNFDNLKAVAFRQFTIRRMCWLGFWTFMRPFTVGAEWFNFKYFHLESCGVSVLLWFIIFMI